MMTDERYKLPVDGILLQLAGCHNPHLIDTVVALVLQDGRYTHSEYRQIADYGHAKKEMLRGRL